MFFDTWKSGWCVHGYMFWTYLNQSGKSTSTIGSNPCKNNEAIFHDYYLCFLSLVPKYKRQPSYECQDLQLKTEFGKLFMAILFTCRGFERNMVNGLRRRNTCSYSCCVLLEMSDLEFEPCTTYSVYHIQINFQFVIKVLKFLKCLTWP